MFFVSVEEPSKKELTPAEKKAEKAKRAAAEKERKKKVNAPARIRKIEVCCMLMTLLIVGMDDVTHIGHQGRAAFSCNVSIHPCDRSIKALSPSWRLHVQGLGHATSITASPFF